MVVRRVASWVRHRYSRMAYSPRVQVTEPKNLIRLGSKYGGWTFQDRESLHGATVISCGLGEDASFDVDLASRYGASIVILDPTPRAVAHFESIVGRMGSKNSRGYVDGGMQPAESYDLSRLTSSSLRLIQKALWVETGAVRFFAPKNPDHVSHSIINFQNDYARDTHSIEVASISMTDLMTSLDLEDLELLKLDIEGAEVAVIEKMLCDKIYPKQILVEFDELVIPSARSRENFTKTHSSLQESGYWVGHFDGRANFLYIHS